MVGGHSIADDEIKFGYAVTGTIHPRRVKANAGARTGDALVFTKRLGTGAELASMVVELITNDYMNAETIRVDGGIRMPPK